MPRSIKNFFCSVKVAVGFFNVDTESFGTLTKKSMLGNNLYYDMTIRMLSVQQAVSNNLMLHLFFLIIPMMLIQCAAKGLHPSV